MTRRFVLALAAVCSLASVFVSTAAANHSWGRYHWARTANPFTVNLGDNVSSTWDSFLRTASSDWTASSVLDSPVVSGSTNSSCQPTSGRVEVCNGAYGTTGWLGVAQIWIFRGKHITQGTTKLNDTYFNMAQYNTPAWRAFVTCQEVGHTFGLDHQDENFNNANLGTCMDYTNDPSTNQHPNQHDYDQLVTIYSHLDSITTVGASAPTGAANSENAAPIAVERSDRISSSTITESFADGSARVTYILWAIPTAR
jgi:hypothetical protein